MSGWSRATSPASATTRPRTSRRAPSPRTWAMATLRAPRSRSRGAPAGDNTYLLTVTTNLGTISGGLCTSPVPINPSEQVGTYEQGSASGTATLSVSGNSTKVAAQGSDLGFAVEKTSTTNILIESKLVTATGTFSLSIPS